MFFFIFICNTVSYAEALEYNGIRRSCQPAAYNTKRQSEEPMPLLEPLHPVGFHIDATNQLLNNSVAEPVHPNDLHTDVVTQLSNEQSQLPNNSIAVEHQINFVTVDVDTPSILTNNGGPIANEPDPLANYVRVEEEQLKFATMEPHSSNEQSQSPNNSIAGEHQIDFVTVDVATSLVLANNGEPIVNEEHLTDYVVGESESHPQPDPLANNVYVKEEQLEFATMEPQDQQEINCLLENNTMAEQSDTEDDEVVFVSVGCNGFPEPIGELRSGLIKRDNDGISGNLCFKQTVCSATF